MPTNHETSRIPRPSRTQLVWICFAASMAVVFGLLSLDGSTARRGFLATSVGVIGESAGPDPVFQISGPLDAANWDGIIIHHLGEPAGDPDSVQRLHFSYGYHGLGYHFLLGNGNGLGDGVVHVGYRWDEQKAGVQSVDRHGDRHNLHSIGICMIGNGNRRPFTDRQVRQLVDLVRRLQQGLGIPADRVYLHRDLVPGSDSPGTFFPAARFREQLLSDPR